MIPENTKTDFHKPYYAKKFGKPLKAWKWYNKKGEWIFCTVCYLTGEIGTHGNILKRFIKFVYKNNEWATDTYNKNNILYNIQEIINSNKPIVILDDELSINILNKTNKDDFVFTTWPGEIHDIVYNDFSILKNKQVYYFSSSYIKSKTVIKYFKSKLKNVIVVDPVIPRPGWNIADDFEKLELTEETIRLWITRYDEPLIKKKDHTTWPFKILGPAYGHYWFLHGENGQIFKVKQGGLSNHQMMHLASLDFWYENFSYITKKGGESIDWNGAIDCLIRECNNKPPFDHNKTRGRGIWCMGDELVIHTGEELIFKDKKIPIIEYSPNGYVYERISEKKLNIEKIDIEKSELLQVKNCIDKLSVTTYLERIYLTGWCVLSFLCGALDWRPHIWITGPAGSGKTAILTYIVLKALGDFKLFAEGGSTAAGIFQKLKKNNDSFPIVHDEVDKRGKESVEAELEIARSCSSTTGKMLKGTANQDGIEYNFNSMFCLSSINTLLRKKSDVSRFSVINVKKNEGMDWKKLRIELIETFSDNICEKMRSRFFYNWKTVKKTIDNFKDEVGVFLGDQRAGDQVGTLLAGYCLLYDMKIFTQKDILPICKKYLGEYDESSEQVSDEIELLNKIFTTKVRYMGNNGTEETTLLNLLKRATGDNENMIQDPKCQKELYKYGISCDDEKNELYISYNHEWIKNILLKDTEWESNYGSVLKRLSFSSDKTKTRRFGNYYHGRAVVLDAGCVKRLSDDIVYMEAGF